MSLIHRLSIPILGALCLFAFSSCASIHCHGHNNCSPVYSGTVYDFEQIAGTNPDNGSGGALGRFPSSFLILVGLADLPFSLLADTVLLPYDIVASLYGN